MIKQYFKIRRFHRVILSSVSSSERRISIFFFLLPRFASHFLVVAKEIRGIDSFPICVYEEPSPLVPRLLERKLRRRAMPLPFVTETYREAAGSFSRQKRFPAKRERRRGAREPVSPFLVRKEDFPPYVLARFLLCLRERLRALSHSGDSRRRFLAGPIDGVGAIFYFPFLSAREPHGLSRLPESERASGWFFYSLASNEDEQGAPCAK